MLSLAGLGLILAASALAAPLNQLPFDAENGQHWAVLVAGSASWANYRHQADVCHAYQVLIKHGFRADRIITFMMDDIANNTENPQPGVIINQPNGPNVYQGIQKDYTGSDVTPENFLNVIKGNKQSMSGIGSGRVLESDSNSNVFINFVDHGGPGIIAFPEDFLHANDLISALTYMNQNNMYKKLVFYLEACESGSMFENLLQPNLGIFATTAADPTHSSYACYYDQTRHTYLGDVYSVNWLQNSDVANLEKETLQQQYVLVKQETNTSQVCQYGDSSFSSDPVSDFQAGKKAQQPYHIQTTLPPMDVIDSRDVELEILRKRIMHTTDPVLKSKFMNQLVTETQKRRNVFNMFMKIMQKIMDEELVDQYMNHRESLRADSAQCHQKATRHFHEKCLNLATNSFATYHLNSFVNSCNDGIDETALIEAIDQVCDHEYTSGVFKATGETSLM